MPRQPRLESETGYYHIMTRGINKEKIFETEQEKEKIMTFIREKTQEELCRIVAYCIMDNHLHLIIISEKLTLISIMKKINISYAMSYNQRHKRIGPVFQDRFKSESIIDESYLYGAIRYIHNNPVKAGMVSKAEDYKWSSVREYVTNEKILIDRETQEETMKGFKSVEDFKDFHRIENETEYLEIQEETKELKEKKAERIMQDYCEEKGITDSRQFQNRDELIMKLLKETKLSYRKIAEMTGTSLNAVYAANKKYRP